MLKFVCFLGAMMLTFSIMASEEVCQDKECSNWCNMGRGVTNIATCVLEVPRSMMYRNSELPLWGFIGGAVEGVGFTVFRAFSGVTDVLFLGYGNSDCFNNTTFKEYVWESDWLPNHK